MIPLQRFDAPGRVGVFAPSSPYPEDRFTRGLDVLRNLGWSIELPDGLDAHAGYLAGDDDHRLAQLHALLDDPNIDVIWAARGGYGLHRLLDGIDVERLARARKPIIGFSDICALHAVAQNVGLITIHGPVITQLADFGASAAQSVFDLLRSDRGPLVFEADTTVTPGTATGPLIGGCLSVIAPLLGTPHMPPLDGAVLLLEDVGEATYRIDRLLTHLRLARVFDRVAAVACGDFWACNPRDEREPTIDAVLADRLGDLSLPVVTGLPFGHGPRNLAVPLGATAVLDATARRLEIRGW